MHLLTALSFILLGAVASAAPSDFNSLLWDHNLVFGENFKPAVVNDKNLYGVKSAPGSFSISKDNYGLNVQSSSDGARIVEISGSAIVLGSRYVAASASSVKGGTLQSRTECKTNNYNNLFGGSSNLMTECTTITPQVCTALRAVSQSNSQNEALKKINGCESIMKTASQALTAIVSDFSFRAVEKADIETIKSSVNKQYPDKGNRFMRFADSLTTLAYSLDLDTTSGRLNDSKKNLESYAQSAQMIGHLSAIAQQCDTYAALLYPPTPAKNKPAAAKAVK